MMLSASVELEEAEEEAPLLSGRRAASGAAATEPSTRTPAPSAANDTNDAENDGHRNHHATSSTSAMTDGGGMGGTAGALLAGSRTAGPSTTLQTTLPAAGPTGAALSSEPPGPSRSRAVVAAASEALDPLPGPGPPLRIVRAPPRPADGSVQDPPPPYSAATQGPVRPSWNRRPMAPERPPAAVLTASYTALSFETLAARYRAVKAVIDFLVVLQLIVWFPIGIVFYDCCGTVGVGRRHCLFGACFLALALAAGMTLAFLVGSFLGLIFVPHVACAVRAIRIPHPCDHGLADADGGPRWRRACCAGRQVMSVAKGKELDGLEQTLCMIDDTAFRQFVSQL